MQNWQIAEEIKVPKGHIQVLTPSGYKDVITAYKTIRMQVWELHTADIVFRGAAEHLIQRADGILVWLQDLKVGDFITTEGGVSVVTNIIPPGEDDELEQLYDFEVDSEDHLYYTDGLLSHNSTSIAARQLMYSHIIPKHRSMYIVPHQSYLDTYANRLREMERAFRFYQSHKDYRQNLKYKEYPNGSVTMLVKCLTDTQEARSKTCAEALFDESSHMNTIVHAIVGEKVVEKKIS